MRGIQIWSSNQAPQIQMAGVNALAQGIGMAGQSLGDSLGKAMEQRKTNSNLATALRKKLGILNPDRKDEFNAMSLPELTGEDMAHAEGVLEKRRKMEEEEADRRRREFEWAEADRRRREEGEAALPRFLDSFGNGAPAPMTPPPALGPAPSDQPWSPPPLMGLPPPDLGSSLTAPPPSPGAMPDGTMGPASLLEALRKNPKVLNSPRFGALWEAFQNQKAPVIGPEALKQFGFVPSGGRVNPNGSASIEFGPPAPQFSDRATPILTTDGQPTGKATFEGKTIDLSPPNSEGKTLTQSENQMLGALNQAGTDLDNLDKIFKKLGKDWGGPLAGRALNAAGVGQNPDIVAVENAINAATPNLARGVFREVGVLTDEDIRRYKALLPTAYDTDAVRSVKMKQLRDRIDQGKKETMDSLRKAGRDVSGFDKAAKAEATKPPPNAAGKTHAQLIEEANAAIHGGADEKAVRQRLKDLGVEVK